MRKVLFLLTYAFSILMSVYAQDASFVFTCDKEISKKLFNSDDESFRLDIGSKARFFTLDEQEVRSYVINGKERDGLRMFFFFEDSNGNQGCVSVAMDVNSVAVIDKSIQKDAFMMKLDMDRTKAYNSLKHQSYNGANNNRSRIIGHWDATDIENNGDMIRLKDIGSGIKLSFVFDSGGDYKQYGFAGDFTGIYSVDGNIIDVYSVYGDKYITYRIISISNDDAIVAMRIESDSNIYKFKIRKRGI